MYLNGIDIPNLLVVCCSLIENISIIRNFGICVDFTLVLIVEPGDGSVASKVISGDHISSLGSHMSPKKYERAINNNDNYVAKFCYTNTRKSKDILSLIDESSLMSSANGENGLFTVVISERFSPMKKEFDTGYEVFIGEIAGIKSFELQDVISFYEISREDLDCELSEMKDNNPIKSIRKKLQEVINDDDTKQLKAMKAAACMIYPLLQITDQTGIFEDVVAECVQNDEYNKLTYFDDVVDLFINGLFQYVIDNKFSYIYCLNDINRKKVGSIGTIMLYDKGTIAGNECLYVGSHIFNKVIEQLTKYISSCEIKMALKMQGVIETYESAGYTVHLPSEYRKAISNIDSSSGENRMYKFNTNLLYIPGKGNLVDLCFTYRMEDRSEYD